MLLRVSNYVVAYDIRLHTNTVDGYLLVNFVDEDEITLNDMAVVDLMTPPFHEMICQQSRCTESTYKGFWSHSVSSGPHLIYKSTLEQHEHTWILSIILNKFIS